MGLKTNTIHKILCIRKSQPALKRSVWALLKYYISTWNLESICSINNTDMTMLFINGSQILCVGLDLAEKIKSIEGITSIFCEEATELTEQDVLQLDLRLRGRHTTYRQITLAFNPIGKNNYIYKMFYEGVPIDTTLHHSTYLDNKYLDDEYKTMLDRLKEKDYNYWLIYAKGAWGELENLIFNNWDIVDDIPTKYTNSDSVYGCDWGYIHKTAIVRAVKDNDDIFVDECYYKDKQTNLDVIKYVDDYLPQGSILYGDSAEPARLEEFRRKGINMKASTKGKNSIKDSIDYIKRHKIHITKRSVGLIQELEAYKWKQSRDGVIKEEPVDFNDDAIAAMRYAIYSAWGKQNTDYKIYTGN